MCRINHELNKRQKYNKSHSFENIEIINPVTHKVSKSGSDKIIDTPTLISSRKPTTSYRLTNRTIRLQRNDQELDLEFGQ